MAKGAPCKLNDTYKKAFGGGDRFQIIDGLIKDIKKDSKWYGTTIHMVNHRLNCCGIDELVFLPMMKEWKAKYQDLSEANWQQLVAMGIKLSLRVQNDQRIVFVGIPVKVGEASMYDTDFYTKLRKTLAKFGFIELCAPYRNRSSNNTITVMAGQIP